MRYSLNNGRMKKERKDSKKEHHRREKYLKHPKLKDPLNLQLSLVM